MMDDWMSANDAAAILAVSPRRVRELVDKGVLPAQQLAGRWLVDAPAVRSRAAHGPPPGRPLSPALAWALLTVVQDALDDDAGIAGGAGDDNRGSDGVAFGRQVRHRLRHLLAQPVSPRRWSSWLAARAAKRRVWVHPGIVERLTADSRVHVGGAAAAARFDLGSARSDVRRLYVLAGNDGADAAHDVSGGGDSKARAAVDDVIREYRLRDDPSGSVELLVVPASAVAAPALLRRPDAVPPAVALADLLESDDSRERHVAIRVLDQLNLHERQRPLR